jgi:hypothetical protein
LPRRTLMPSKKISNGTAKEKAPNARLVKLEE